MPNKMVEVWSFSITKIDWVRTNLGMQDTVLDIGCADRFMWKESHANVICLDKRFSYEGDVCIPDVIGEAEHLPFSDNSFDIAILGEILEHVVSPQKVLSEAVRVAKLKVILTVPWEYVWTKNNKPFTHPEHIRFYHPLFLKQELQCIGLPFQIISISFNGMVWLAAEIYGCAER